LKVDGVFDRRLRHALVRSLPTQRATWYDGETGYCGDSLETMGVAHLTLPCGTKVAIGYRGRWVRVRVVDRGPSAWTGNDWDLTKRAAAKLGILRIGVAAVRVAVVGRAR
jgi:rare lipoprotein A (peptidoglycan hydrolase)